MTLTERDSFQAIYSNLVAYFGSQEKTAESLDVTQPAVSGWISGKKLMSVDIASKAEKATNGKFKAVDLCPALKRFADLQNTA